jgi:hypothetical protein
MWHLVKIFFLFSGPTEDIPVKVTGNVKNGFNAEFVPVEVGIHMILVTNTKHVQLINIMSIDI